MQHFLDLHDDPTHFGDPKWDPNSSSTHHSSAANGNLDRVLFQDLVEIVPLVQSLIDRKASSSFTRRGSVTYTKMPSRESLSKKVANRNEAQSIPARKKRETTGDNTDADSVSSFSSRAVAAEKEHEELEALRVQLEDLHRKFLEKDELLKSSEMSKNEVSAVQAKLEEVKRQAVEKDSLIKASQLQLSDAKIKLADKQAALEKSQWEAMTSNKSAEKLRTELDSLRGDISSIMTIFEGLVKTITIADTEDYDISPCTVDHLPYIEDWDEMKMQNMEAARKAYEAAVVAARERQDEESIAAAASARLHLQSFVLKS
ncbi:protein MICROTUBULE BINDING PROTEIN 2C [Argentina anserina]|uniref:protein MICROTUBULE BINDING PROTEIN 2C n=1 Tax=Argentina anserina TaxID=57926 RepID=UPI0021765412|nr:protein MICROTUBULE BINDING PROTEIN 2C [Potentilla anserina]